jgi:FAD/FMN-containing dehydrogenase/Fe-S oxidoreductase
MSRFAMSLSYDFLASLQKSIAGEVRFDPISRLLYSTDASIYQIEPLGVVFPRDLDDLSAIVTIAAEYQVPLLARGSGSSLAGQAIGKALIIDCSRYLYHQVEVNSEEMTATVAPGVILNNLNRAAAVYGLQFGPDPASAERATLGGSLANNASGAHSIIYGMAADHLLSAEVVLADGSLATFKPMTLREASRKARLATDQREQPHPIAVTGSLEANIYAAAIHIRDNYVEAIQDHWPRTWRRASGYNLNYLLPWSPSKPPQWTPILPYPPVAQGTINLAPLLAASEGTLAIIRRASLRLVPRPRHTILGVLAYPDLVSACDAVPGLLDSQPSAIELIPSTLIYLAQSIPAYARQVSIIANLVSGQKEQDQTTLLVVEFSGDNPVQLKERALKLSPKVLLAETPAAQKQVWAVRKVGLGILTSQPGDLRPITVIEDMVVPVERLGEFVREMEHILINHGTRGDFYAHASAGCLHMRPILNLKTREGMAELRTIATEAMSLVLRLGGSISGEHGVGLARSEWMEQAYGSEVIAAFRELKSAADPQNIFNPGKILDPQPMDTNLRISSWFVNRTEPGVVIHDNEKWHTILDFSRQAGIIGAIELCNGAGVCRKSEGVMCPSFQATGEEMHSTRGRANLLRALMTSGSTTQKQPGGLDGNALEEAVHEALDLCLACKGCKAECPSAVDMAKLKYEFSQKYYQTHRRKWRDYLFGYIGLLARTGHFFAPLVNPLLRQPFFRRLADRWFGLAPSRIFPALSARSLRNAYSSRAVVNHCPPVFFLSDPFTEYFFPGTGLAALDVLIKTGFAPQILPIIGAGRTLISKGFLESARSHARQLVDTIYRLDPMGEIPVVGIEPSEVFSLRDEYLDLLPEDERVKSLSKRAWMLDEFLIRPGLEGKSPIQNFVDTLARMRDGTIISRGSSPEGTARRVMLHGHCYQKAQPPSEDGFPTGMAATVSLLEAVGYKVSTIESSCCGMAGAFGYESEHFDISMRVGELGLFPTIRAADEDVIIAASGISCQSQIEDGTGRHPVHPIVLVQNVLGLAGS